MLVSIIPIVLKWRAKVPSFNEKFTLRYIIGGTHDLNSIVKGTQKSMGFKPNESSVGYSHNTTGGNLVVNQSKLHRPKHS